MTDEADKKYLVCCSGWLAGLLLEFNSLSTDFQFTGSLFIISWDVISNICVVGGGTGALLGMLSGVDPRSLLK